MDMNETLTELDKAKYWFGDGEIDVDLMIACGAVTEDNILKMYRNEIKKLNQGN